MGFDNKNGEKRVTNEKRPKVINGRVIDGIVPTKLTEDVFLIIVDGFSKYESQTKICERAGITRTTLRQWLNDPNPVGIVAELHEAINEIWAAPLCQLFLKAQELLMKRLVEPRKTICRTQVVYENLTLQEYNKIVDEFGEEAAKHYRDIVQWRSSTVGD